MNKSILNLVFNSESKVLNYAAKELQRFLKGSGYVIEENIVEYDEKEKYDRIIRLSIDKSLLETSFLIKSSINPYNISVTELVGHGESEVLSAVYTLLEKVGIKFEITGPIIPEKLDLSEWEQMDCHIVPAVKHRGIRQHINFPMDISSYTIEDAKEYIRNLARLKMNYIAFHSYPGQWYECKMSQKEYLAGSFFYAQKHEIPKQHFIKNFIQNKDFFCIPEIEPFFEDQIRKSKASIEWLNEVMDEAEEVGMQIRMCFELMSQPIRDCIKLFEAVSTLYPRVDTIEFITQECGAWAYPVLPKEKLESMIRELFDEELLEDGRIGDILEVACKEIEDKTLINSGIWQLPGTLEELATNIKVVNELIKYRSKDKKPKLALGVYATDHSTLRIIEIIMKKYVPSGISISLLPAHGARAVVDSLGAMELDDEMLKKCMIYSWIEFDGNMYLQQNAIEGNNRLLKLLENKLMHEQIYGICLNHWRTEENRTSLRFAASAFIQGAISAQEFYMNYSGAMGIKALETYSRAMVALDEVDNDVRNKVANIGFCVKGCWWKKELGYFGIYKIGIIEEISKKYTIVRDLLLECQKETGKEEGIKYLEFLINRIECTVIHLNAVGTMTKLQRICEGLEPASLTEKQKLQIEDICTEALKLTDKYMKLHTESMPDRGCEGTLISYYHTMPEVIERVKGYYTKGYVYDEGDKNIVDLPPPPAI